ncbi:MAG TPA: caspase family protein [Anaeromyxobacter sp.]|nr:caspase family protein [Anaeromyxobacter sp.]
MTPRGRALALLVALLAPGEGLAAARFAVIVGSNTGAAGRPRLWFAEKDAERFRHTLIELGEFSEDRAVLLREPRAAQVREALGRAEAAMAEARRAGEHPLLVFYFSGHAGPGGIELGDERLSFDELRALIGSASADARVAIVDACEAGLLTQVKGATAAPALDFPLPSDERVRGTAFIASTAVGEAAQESAAIGGSFFTHHLEIALRGAGDVDGDGLVTLSEAFRYTAAQTLAGTVATVAGAQHATYDFKMSGRGDVVLSDLRHADARLTLPRDPEATFVLKGPLSILAEVAGGEKPITLALPAGRYRIERRAPEGRAVSDLQLDHGGSELLGPLSPTRYELARAKGGPKPGLLFAGAGLATMGLPGFGAAPTVQLGVRKELGPMGLRLRLDWMGKSVADQGLRYDLSYVGGAVAGLYPLNTGRILVEAGPELGWGYATQKLADQRSFGSGVFFGGAALMVTAPVGPVRLGVDASAGVEEFRLNDQATWRAATSLSLLALWGF